MGVYIISVSHIGSIVRYSAIEVHSVLLAEEMSNEMVYLPCISLDAIVNQTSLCIFIVLFVPAVFDGSVCFPSWQYQQIWYYKNAGYHWEYESCPVKWYIEIPSLWMLMEI
jgi:hypothetical protein